MTHFNDIKRSNNIVDPVTGRCCADTDLNTDDHDTQPLHLNQKAAVADDVEETAVFLGTRFTVPWCCVEKNITK